MLGYSKILCALDFDEYAAATLRIAAAIAKESNATVYLLHIARIPGRDQDVPLPFEASPLWEKEARERLEALMQSSLTGEVRFEITIESGLPELDIVRMARQLAVDLIVMATHGRSGFSHLLFGSVAEHVIREAACPVLTLRPPKENQQSADPAS
jgi:nucleotide-binding universal stress UspA family protein